MIKSALHKTYTKQTFIIISYALILIIKAFRNRRVLIILSYLINSKNLMDYFFFVMEMNPKFANLISMSKETYYDKFIPGHFF